MNFWESMQVSIEGLSANKMRSILTMLGVIIGVGAVITMLSIAQGAKSQMMGRIQQMGTNVLIVRSGQARQGAVFGGFGSVQTLTLKDADAVLKKCPSVLHVSAEVQNNAQVVYRNVNTSTTIIGASPSYPSVRNYKVQNGVFFTDSDIKAMRKVAVIGPVTALNLFGNDYPIGKTIQIKGTSFQIIGETGAKGAAGGQADDDDVIIIPVTTAMRRLFGLDNIRTIGVEARSMAVMDQASDEIGTTLRKTHRLAPGADDDFIIRNQAQFMDLANQASGVFTMLLGGIACVSLIVGGIGIMNIMLVSVTERTREIGIRMAIGARRSDIRMQFLVEALVLSLLGGLVGIVAGSIGAYFAARGFGWAPSLSLSSIGMSFGFAAFVGIFFGYYPALKASQLDPIDALRYE